jgi:hypothetical protein
VLLQVLEARRRVDELQVDERAQDVAPLRGRDLPGVGGGLGGDEPAARQEGGQIVLLLGPGGVLDDASPVDERPGPAGHLQPRGGPEAWVAAAR